MKVTPLTIPDVLLIEPKVFGDDRGYFFESFNQQRFNEATGLDLQFVQDNHSKSAKNVLRGLHYQLPPKAQGKLVRAVAGEVFDVAVDIRKDVADVWKMGWSDSFGREQAADVDSARVRTWLSGAQRFGGISVQGDGLLRARIRTGLSLE